MATKTATTESAARPIIRAISQRDMLKRMPKNDSEIARPCLTIGEHTLPPVTMPEPVCTIRPPSAIAAPRLTWLPDMLRE